MRKSKFKEHFEKYKQRLSERHQIICAFYISGMTKADIARGEKVTPPFISKIIKNTEEKFIKWNK